MTKTNFEQYMDEALISYIAEKVIERLTGAQKKAIVVFTGSTMGFERSLEELKKLREEGYEFHAFLTRSAKALLDEEKIKEALGPERIIGDNECVPEQLAKEFDLMIVPSMTINTAAKIACCIADAPAARLISNSMMRGKRTIIAVDGCCPDNQEREEKGYHMTPALKEHLRGNLEKLRDFGAELTTGERLYKKVKGEKTAAPAGRSKEKNAVAINKKIIGNGDIAANKNRKTITVPKEALVTQLAQETAKSLGIRIIKE